VDYVSIHRYYGNPTDDTPGFLARSMDMDAFIQTVASICDAVRGKKHSKKRLHLSFDEWNVWYHSNAQDKETLKRETWGRALPLLEEVYNFEDALLVGCMLVTMLRNADRVKIACMAQLVNALAPIMTRTGGGAWAQTIYWPLLHASAYGRGTSLRPVVDAPAYDCADYERVPELDAAAVLGDDGVLTLFMVNRAMQEDLLLTCDLRAFGDLVPAEHIVLAHPDVKAVNTEANPDNVRPAAGENGTMDGGTFTMRVPKLSWNVVRLAPRKA
ncbi:MAG TPA: alpha-L-arabinofuranosidase C-terminal domain-containing protein, partial [Candidatus Limnocylindria bacterium]|nr:alpha-L-arabinofuranosidase C-terminal domain-containing protein [Candidatus Limnocylindria bacterium]